MWGRRGALVVEDGGGDTFRRMAQAYQVRLAVLITNHWMSGRQRAGEQEEEE